MFGPGNGLPPLPFGPWQFLHAFTLTEAIPNFVGIGPELSAPVSKIIWPSATPVTWGVEGADGVAGADVGDVAPDVGGVDGVVELVGA